MSDPDNLNRGPELAAAVHEARDRGDARAAIVAELEFQAHGCEIVGSPLYAGLLANAAADAQQGGIAWEILRGRAADPPFTALSLRMLAAVHRLVLTGRAPALARFYPTAGGDAGRDGAWAAFRATLEENADEVRDGLARPCQTNEAGRTAALLGGFLAVAAETGLPLRILEIGASAGLNLRWDHFRYVGEGASWGPAGSPVVFAGVYEKAPPLDTRATVAERRGVDLNPQDPTTEATRLNLMSSAWPDQAERFQALEGALLVARQVPATVDTADGPTWLEAQLAQARPGVATVVYHSIVMQYLTDAGRARFSEVIAAAGGRASSEAPLAWLSFEPGGSGRAHVNLATWPGEGTRRLIATSGYHGRPVCWLGADGGEVSPGQGFY